MAMHLTKLAGTAIVLSLVVHPGYAVELIPIELTAISQAVDVSLLAAWNRPGDWCGLGNRFHRTWK